MSLSYGPLFIHSFSFRFTPAGTLRADVAAVNPASAAWPAANRAIYVPLVLPFAYSVKRVFWVNGATVTANADVGIFSARTLSRLFSVGSTAQSGASVPQYVTVDWLIPPGEYYMAMALSLSTASVFRSATQELPAMKLTGYVQEASALPLPSTMTPVTFATTYLPLFGITRTASGY